MNRTFHTSLPLSRLWLWKSRLWAVPYLLVAALFVGVGQAVALPLMKVGNLVFVDSNGNGVADFGEGKDGVTVELWKVSEDQSSYDLIGTQVTAGGGFYVFEGLTSGTYHVTIPTTQFGPEAPLEGMFCLPSAIGFGEGDDNLGQKGQGTFAPALTGINTNDFIVAPGFGPTGAEESGFMGDYDDADDGNGDMTIDLGFYRPLAIGNLVFVDANGNGHFDQGEGIGGVAVQLYHETDTPGLDPSLLDLVTDETGHFLFGGLQPGYYKLFVPAWQFQQGGPLAGAHSVPGVGSATEDDDISEDGLDSDHPELTGITSRTITLAAGFAPTTADGETGSNFDDDLGTDSDVDLTVDLGFVLPAGKVGVGNLVFIDANNNGHYDDGEGAAGVKVELYAAAEVPELVATVQTASDGSYLISNIDPGSYFLKVPASEFAPGKILFSALSVVGNVSGDDDSGEDGVDALYPEVTGIKTQVFSLSVGGAPVDGGGESGYLASSDNFNDSNVDLTHDFGFTLRALNPVGVGNLVFVDANHNGKFDTGEGVGNVTMQLFREGDDVDVAEPVATQQTGPDGNYLFGGLIPGRYFVHVAASNFYPEASLSGLLSMTGNGVDNQADDDKDENGIDSANPSVTGISSVVIDLAEGTEPVEVGFNAAQDDELETNTDLTVDFGFKGPCPELTVNYTGSPTGAVGVQFGAASYSVASAPSALVWSVTGGVVPPGMAVTAAGNLIGTPSTVGSYNFTVTAMTGDGCSGSALCSIEIMPAPGVLGVGNAIYFDANGNGVMDSGEGVAGVTLKLFLEGDNPITANPQATTVTTVTGSYLFSGLTAGRYFVHVPASNFALNKPLHAAISAPGVSTDNGVDDNVPGNDNGVDAADPASTGVNSIVFELAEGTEPVDGPTGSETGSGAGVDNEVDSNVDLTIDLAFVAAPQSTLGLGNAIYIDANHNGVMDSGEGVAGVKVQLFHGSDDLQTATPVDETTTSNLGAYSFSGLAAGDWKVRVPASEFAIGKPLHGLISIPGVSNDDGVDDNVPGNDNGVDAADPELTGVASVVVNLSPGAEPVDTESESGFDSAADNAHDADFDATVDLGFQVPCPTLVISPSVLPDPQVNVAFTHTLSVTGGAGPFVFSIKTGVLPGGVTLSTAGILSGTATVIGSYPITIRATTTDGCFVDWVTSLVIHGPLAVGNLVFFDKNGNGRADAGEGVDGVVVELYRSMDTPGSTTPVGTATTANGGFYLIDNVLPAQYKLFVPPAMFAAGAPLWKTVSVAGVGTADDDAGEAGQDAAAPGNTGVVTAPFTLGYGTAPTAATGETGLGSASDDDRDADVDLTRDFGFVDKNALPAVFNSWATAHGLTAGNSAPTANPDNDAYSNLIEYALGSNPAGGSDGTGAAFVLTQNPTTGKMDFVLRRRHGGQGDLKYTLQVLPDLALGQWTASSVVPVVVNNGDGTESLTFGDLDSDPALQGSNSGFVRILVELDSDLDGITDASDTTPVLGWQRRSLALQNQTYAVSFVPVPVLTGTPDGVTGNNIDLTTALGGGTFASLFVTGHEYYVEVMSGANQGHRWEVDEAASTGTSLVLLPLDDRSTLASVPSTLTGDLIALRSHWRMVDLFPPASYHATNNSSTADQILVWDPNANGYVTLWLANYFGQKHWHNVAVASVTATEDNRVIGPCDGLFARPKFATVNTATIGQLRTWKFACPLKKGVNFIGNPFPSAQSPSLRGMYGSGGFTANANPSSADKISFWAGDTSTSTGYASYQLFKAGTREIWKVVGSTDIVTDWGTRNLFTAGTAAFITSINGRAGWMIPAPVVP